jgi:thiol:disulfide interchange protein DsbC
VLSKKHFIQDIFHRLLAILFLSFSLLAQAGANEDIVAIQSIIESRSPPLKAKSIKASPIAGLYEVFIQGNLIYTDKTFSYLIINGAMMDSISKRNLTEESLKELTAIKFSDLPLQNAIKIKKGSGTYNFAVFSDPDCPYCKSLESGLVKAGATDFTAYIFLYPLKTLHPDAASKSESIWCAKDKAEAWSSFMLKGTAPEKSNCDNPLTANEKLADEIGVRGTPTIYLNNGQQTQDLLELVAAIKAKR